MSAGLSDYSRPQRGLAWRWAAVLLLHLGLLLVFVQARQAGQTGKPPAMTAARTVVTLLLFKPPPQRERPPRAAPAARARRPIAPIAPSQAEPARQPAIEPTTTRPVPPSATAPEDRSATAAHTQSERTAPLQLALPGRAASGALPAMAEMVRRDARANSRRLSVEERLAAALGNAEVSEEQIKAGHTRFRQGSSCIDVQDMRIGQLQPFDAVARGAPRLVSSCKK